MTRLWRLLVLGVLLAARALGAEAASLRFFTTVYPPYAGPELRSEGPMVVLTRQLLADTGWQIQVEYQPWARLGIELAGGRHDGVLLMWPDDFVRHKLAASDPIFLSRLGLYVRSDQHRPQGPGLARLRGQRVGAVAEYAYPKAIMQSGLLFDRGISDASTLQKLAARRFDYALVEYAVGEHWLGLQPPPVAVGQVVWQEPALVELPLYIGVVPDRAHSAELLDRINTGLRRMRASGELARFAKAHGLDLAPASATRAERSPP